MLRILTIAGYLLFLIFLVIVFAVGVWQSGLPTRAQDILAVVGLLTLPIVNLAYCYTVEGSSWIALYLRRKALEEQKRINDLDAEQGSGGRRA